MWVERITGERWFVQCVPNLERCAIGDDALELRNAIGRDAFALKKILCSRGGDDPESQDIEIAAESPFPWYAQLSGYTKMQDHTISGDLRIEAKDVTRYSGTSM